MANVGIFFYQKTFVNIFFIYYDEKNIWVTIK